jgi:hypothetical protein
LVLKVKVPKIEHASFVNLGASTPKISLVSDHALLWVFAVDRLEFEALKFDGDRDYETFRICINKTQLLVSFS